MKQYVIYRYNKLPRFVYEIIKSDSQWFYSNYYDESGKYILLRLSKEYEELNAQLKSKNIKYEIKDYNDIHECGVTMQYFEQFVALFHAESVLIQKTAKKDREKILERIIHLAYNMAGYSYINEAMAIAQSALYKMYTAGSLAKDKNKT